MEKSTTHKKRRHVFLEKAFEKPFRTFERISSNGGLTLLFVGTIALIWANSPLQELYTYLVEEFHVSIDLHSDIGGFGVGMHSIHWINDGLMTLFFLMAGLEIKREMLAGELSDFKQAILPIFAAAGGMLVPILIYKCFSIGMDDAVVHGWGIPMATDIAFSIGILSLLGNRVPLSLKVFLTALAIVDDLGGVLVIALFYTSQINFTYLFIALALFGVISVLNLVFNVEKLSPYLIIGCFIWYFMLQSGIHSTIAGVLVAIATPLRPRVTSTVFIDGIKEVLPTLTELKVGNKEGRYTTVVLSQEQMAGVHAIHELVKNIQSPLQYLEQRLHEVVNYVVLPLFALANSGVIVYNYASDVQPELFSIVTVAIAASLFVGKTIGITLFSWFAVKLGLAEKPKGSSWHTMMGIAMIGGIGFTMSLFIASLAFSDPNVLTQAKLGIFIGSTLAGVCGYFYLRYSLARDEKNYAHIKSEEQE
ncbi:MAG: Na+/H+ antiporter NhaA [Bacteroidia bacterium]|nr:Na+/H+ antiporter NhaA [Bacteroidia bacterium]